MFPAVFVQKSVLRTIINNILDLKKNFADLLSVKLVFENVVDYHYEREMCKKDDFWKVRLLFMNIGVICI